jgi:2-dehydropantoate 2-reductase
MQKVLVYGAGVLGSYLAHVLLEAGQDVSVVARGARKTELEMNGLVIRHHLQRKTTVDRPAVVKTAEGVVWSAVFAAMQYQQMAEALPALARVETDLLVLVGNNVDAGGMARALQALQAKAKTVVFGFQSTGGRRENGRVVCVRFGAGRLNCGFADKPLDDGTRTALGVLFAGTEYSLAFHDSMAGWYLSHLAFILPMAYLCYAHGCDLTRATWREIGLVIDAMREGYRLLREAGIPVMPEDADTALDRRGKRASAHLTLWVMVKTSIGRLAASDHCRNAVGEMQTMDAAFDALRARHTTLAMPAWQALRAAVPDWQALHRTFDRA